MEDLFDYENNIYINEFIDNEKLYLIFRLMKYSILANNTDPTFYAKLDKEEQKQTLIYKNLKMIKIICEHFRVYKLSKEEKNNICTLTTDQIYDYLIERTNKINNYCADPLYPINNNNIKMLIELKNKYSYDLSEHLHTLQNQLIANFENDIIIKTIHEANYKPNKPEPLTKKIEGKKLIIENDYISIDVKSSNFSWLFNYIGNFIFKLGVPSTYEEFTRQFTDDNLIAQSKMLRQIVFGMVFKKYQLFGIYEKDMKYITSLFTNLIINKYPYVKIAMVMNEECVIYKTGDITIDNIKKELEKLIPIIGIEMTNKLNVTEFRYRRVNNVVMKNNTKVLLTPELSYSIIHE